MSVVFKGRHKMTDQEVALKILPPEPRGTQPGQVALPRRGEGARRPRSSNIVHLYNFGQENGSFVLAMPVEGQTWERLILENKRLDWTVSPDACDVLKALEYARPRRDPPRHEAVERARARPRPHGDGDGLRHREDDDVDEADRDRPDDGHGPLHVARAGARPGGRLQDRHLLARRDALRVADRRDPVRRPHPLRDHDQALVGAGEAPSVPVSSCRKSSRTR